MLEILNDKFTPAQLPEIYAPRHELLNYFQKASETRLIYISAPAGFGKTVSALLWLKNSGRQSVWLGLDSYDNSLSVFYKLLATAIASTQPDNENMRRALHNPTFSSSPVAHIAELLVEFRPDNNRFALVLDDMHLVTNEEIAKSLPDVLKRLPRSFTVLILSRKEPSSAILEMEQAGRAEIIRKDHLAFSESEAHQYFVSMGRYLTPEESKFTHSITNGWAIGINAIAKSGKLILGSNGEILDHYIRTQLWDKWDESRQSFLLKTAVVDEFESGLAVVLTGEIESREILDMLCADNAFISYQGNNLYRYHHLFLDFLRNRLDEDTTIHRSALYKKAAQYYRDRDNRLLSLHYYLKSGDYEGIGPYFYSYVFDESNRAMEENIEYFALFFGSDFPRKAFSEYPALHISAVWYNYVTGRHAEMEDHLDALYKSIPIIALKNPEYMEYIVLAHSVDHRQNFLTQVKRFDWIGRFIKEFTNGRVTRSIVSYTHNLPYLHRSNRDYCELSMDANIMNRLENTFGKVLGTEWPYVQTGAWAGFAFERNELKEALELSLETEKRLLPANAIEGHFAVKVLSHSIYHAMGRHSEAKSALEDITNLVNLRAKYFTPNFEAYKTRFSLWNANKNSAQEWLGNYFVNEPEQIELYKIFQHFTTARAYITLGKFDDALRYVQKLDSFGRHYRRPLDIAEAGVLKSIIEWYTGNKKDAQNTLESVLCDMQPYRFIRIISDEGAMVIPALKRISRKIADDGYRGPLKTQYVSELILAAHEISKRHRGLVSTISADKKPTKLSRQQKQMLKLLSEGYSQAKIAAITGLKIPTIKTHTSLAYQKLGVNNALDAVLKARELGLLE